MFEFKFDQFNIHLRTVRPFPCEDFKKIYLFLVKN